MPNRDYAVRSKSKSGGNKLLILFIVLLLLLLSGLGLWFLNKSDVATQKPQNVVQTPPKKELPTRPEEIYSYIRDLETREVPVDKNSKLARLTKEQEQQILKQQEEEKRKQEQQFAETQTPTSAPTETTAVEQTITEQPTLTAEQLAEQKAKEKKLEEEKLKQAELKKQQELERKAELLKQHLEKEREKAKAGPKPEPAKTEQAKPQPAQPKVVATTKPANEAPKSVGKYGLQCGAFKNKAQAENMQARLAMAGYNARINSSAEWNRVVVGPVGDRAAASAAQSNARSVAECLIVGM